jgi:hypothetical protein
MWNHPIHQGLCAQIVPYDHHGLGVPPNCYGLDVPPNWYGLLFLLIDEVLVFLLVMMLLFSFELLWS